VMPVFPKGPKKAGRIDDNWRYFPVITGLPSAG
jgi:hypothetical protein